MSMSENQQPPNASGAGDISIVSDRMNSTQRYVKDVGQSSLNIIRKIVTLEYCEFSRRLSTPAFHSDKELHVEKNK
jgi:hypothetical protein